jgi:hypothetical protein
MVREDAFSPDYTASAEPAPGHPGRSSVSITVDPEAFSGRLFRRAWEERDEYKRYRELVRDFSSGSVLMGDDRLVLTDEREARFRPPGAELARRSTVAHELDRVERMLTRGALTGMSMEKTAGVYAEITRTTLKGSSSIPSKEARAELESSIDSLLDLGEGQEEYGLLSLTQVRDIKSQLKAARLDARTLPTLHRIIMPYLDSLRIRVSNLQPTFEIIDTFVTAVNDFLDRKKLTFSAGRGIELHGRGDIILQPENLSSGEKHLLLLLSVATLATEERPLVIIDEPELSLGIDWQRILLRQLLLCSSSGKVQFLIASHSLQVMGDLDDDDILVPSEK